MGTKSKRAEWFEGVRRTFAFVYARARDHVKGLLHRKGAARRRFLRCPGCGRGGHQRLERHGAGRLNEFITEGDRRAVANRRVAKGGA